MENNVIGGTKLAAFAVVTACLFAIASMGAKSISEQVAQNNAATTPSLSSTIDPAVTQID